MARHPDPGRIGGCMATQRQWLALDQAARTRLEQLKLSERQIRALEEVVQGMRASVLVTGVQQVSQVKAPLDGAADHLASAHRHLQAMVEAATTGGASALRDAANHLYAAASQHQMAPEQLDALIGQLQDLECFARAALAQLPAQARSQAASTLPVKAIWETIQHHHDRRTQQAIRLSSAPASSFRDICAVCYEAATGKADADPERAVKAFVAQQRKSEATARAEVAVSASPVGGAEQIFDAKAEQERLPERRQGHQVKKKRDLAS